MWRCVASTKIREVSEIQKGCLYIRGFRKIMKIDQTPTVEKTPKTRKSAKNRFTKLWSILKFDRGQPSQCLDRQKLGKDTGMNCSVGE